MSDPRVAKLRQLLSKRFPTTQKAPARAVATGIDAIDEVARGIPYGAVTDIVSAAPSCGSALLFDRVLVQARHKGIRVALVDAANTFHPAIASEGFLAHLLWAHCKNMGEAVAVTDLLVRDGNHGVVCLDSRNAERGDLKRVASTAWYRPATSSRTDRVFAPGSDLGQGDSVCAAAAGAECICDARCVGSPPLCSSGSAGL